MTIDELIDSLKPLNWQVQKQTKHHQYVIYDQNHAMVATIDTKTPHVYQLVDLIDNRILYNTIKHFADTPLNERENGEPIQIQLSQTEIDALYQLPTHLQTDYAVVTNRQVHALRHLKRQINVNIHRPKKTKSKKYNQ